MVFVTLICLVVAAYFLWEALKDKRNADASRSLSAAHKIGTATADNSASVNSSGNQSKTQSDNLADMQAATTTGSPVDKQAGKQAGMQAVNQTAAQASTQSSTQSDARQHTADSQRAAQGEGGPSNSNDLAPDALSARASSNDAAQSTTASIPTNQPSANDSNVKMGAAAVTAAAAVAAAGASATQSTKLRFLDGPIGRKDDLTRIDGVGPVIEEGLNNVGIFHYHQIANFTDDDIRNVDAELDFPGRIAREDWVEQARKLSSISLEQSSLEDTNDQLDSVVSIDQHAPNFTHPDSVLTDADYTGVWNTDVLIEVQERLKVLNTRISDAPRLRMTRDEYAAIKAGEDDVFSRPRLLEILDRLRELD